MLAYGDTKVALADLQRHIEDAGGQLAEPFASRYGSPAVGALIGRFGRGLGWLSVALIGSFEDGADRRRLERAVLVDLAASFDGFGEPLLERNQIVDGLTNQVTSLFGHGAQPWTWAVATRRQLDEFTDVIEGQVERSRRRDRS